MSKCLGEPVFFSQSQEDLCIELIHSRSINDSDYVILVILHAVHADLMKTDKVGSSVVTDGTTY